MQGKLVSIFKIIKIAFMARRETLKRIESSKGTNQQHRDELVSDASYNVNKTASYLIP